MFFCLIFGLILNRMLSKRFIKLFGSVSSAFELILLMW